MGTHYPYQHYSGSAYVYRSTEDGSPPHLLAKLVSPATAGVMSDQFGFSVAVGNDGLVAVGAPEDDEAFPNAGAVYLYRVDTTGVQLLAKVVTTDFSTIGPYFGRSVAIGADDLLVVGGQSGNNYTGAAYVYRLNATGTPELLATLVADDGMRGDAFGFAVAADSDGLAVVGSPADDTTKGSNSGSAYVFRFDMDGLPQLVAKLVTDDDSTEHRFGSSVAIGGEGLVVIGEALDSGDNGVASGAAHVYRVGAASATLVAKLKPDDNEAYDNFGHSVSVGAQGLIAIGAYADSHNGTRSGSAYVYRLVDGLPELVTKLVPDDSALNDNFGASLAVGRGDALVLVAAPFDDTEKGFDSGSVYLYSRNITLAQVA